MPAPSALDNLTPEQRDELAREITRRNFKDYDGLVAWLSEQGLEISRSTVARHGKNLKRRLQQVKDATEGARLIAEASPDDAGIRNAAVISLVQSEMFNAMVSLQELDEDTDPINRIMLLKEATTSVLNLSRAAVNQKKWELEIRGQERQKSLDAMAKTAKAEGVSEETINRIRTEVLGFA
jgi:arginine repressor